MVFVVSKSKTKNLVDILYVSKKYSEINNCYEEIY